MAARMQIQVGTRNRDLHAGPAQRSIDLHPHLGIGHQIGLDIGQPVIDYILDRARVEARADAVRHRLGRDKRYFAALERRVYDGNDLPRRPFVADAELDRPPPGYALVATASEQRDPIFHQLRVRDDDGHVVDSGERRIPPTDRDYLAGLTLDLDPIADATCIVELQ